MEEARLAAAYPFWGRLSGGEKERILRSAAEARYEKGAMIQRSDLECKGAILVLSGVLRVYIVSDEGREVTQPVLRMTHDEIARNIGSAREVVSKVLKYLSEEGAVALKRGRVEIRDKEKLRKYL